MEAAFFDLDKTVIARSSLMVFAPALRRAGLLRRRRELRGAWTQLVYLRWGAGPRRLARIQRRALAVSAGWSQAAVRELVAAGVAGAVERVTYREALERMAEHRGAGRLVVLLSAAPDDVVEPIGRRLGVDRVVASRPAVDAEGRYTGRLERYVSGPAKATVMRELAEREGVDLTGSWAYTDSFTDLPMLEAVGHPVAVNPDRALRRVAAMRGWPVERFEARATTPLPPRPAEGRSRPRGRWIAWPALAVAVATGGITAWWAWRRPSRA